MAASPSTELYRALPKKKSMEIGIRQRSEIPIIRRRLEVDWGEKWCVNGSFQYKRTLIIVGAHFHLPGGADVVAAAAAALVAIAA